MLRQRKYQDEKGEIQYNGGKKGFPSFLFLFGLCVGHTDTFQTNWNIRPKNPWCADNPLLSEKDS